MAYENEDDLSAAERARLGISFSHKVYIMRDTTGEAVAVKTVDPMANKESVIDLKVAMPKEGRGTLLEIVKGVYSGMRRLPQNYATYMAPDGMLTRAQRSGVVGYSAERSLEENGRVAQFVVGNSSAMQAFIGRKRAAASDAYGAGSSDGYKGDSSADSYGRGGEAELWAGHKKDDDASSLAAGGKKAGKDRTIQAGPAARHRRGRGAGAAARRGKGPQEEGGRNVRAPSPFATADFLEIELLLTETAAATTYLQREPPSAGPVRSSFRGARPSRPSCSRPRPWRRPAA